MEYYNSTYDSTVIIQQPKQTEIDPFRDCNQQWTVGLSDCCSDLSSM